MIFTVEKKQEPNTFIMNQQKQVTVAIGQDEQSVIGKIAADNNMNVDIGHVASIPMELVNLVIAQHKINITKWTPSIPITPEKEIEKKEELPPLNIQYSPERSFVNMITMVLEDDNSKELRQKLSKLDIANLTKITKKLCNSV